MVAALTQHDTKWVSPSPLWSEFSDTGEISTRKNFQRPAILRFNTDSFMDELLSVMNYYPENLFEWRAQPETWREPMAPPPTAEKLQIAQPLSQFKKIQMQQLKLQKAPTASVDVSQEVVNDKPLKLYQPAHLRFYLVTASFVCRKVGLPDRKVDLAKNQKVEFILRRLLPKDLTQAIDPKNCDVDKCDEYAFLSTDEGRQWKKVKESKIDDNKIILGNEERLPMFNVGYEESADKRRRMLAGYIPVAQRESYLNADISENSGSEGNSSVNEKANSVFEKKRDAIVHLFLMQIAEPWKNLISEALNEENKSDDWNSNAPDIVERPINPPENPAAKSNLKISREKIQTTSWYVLVDLVQFLKDYVPNIYSYIENSVVPSGFSAAESDLYDALNRVRLTRSDYKDTIDNTEYIGDSYHDYDDLYGALIPVLKHLIDQSDDEPDIETQLDLVDSPYDRNIKNIESDHQWPSFLFPLADPIHQAPVPEEDILDPSDADEQIDALTALVANAIPSDLQKNAPDVTPIKIPKQNNTLGWFVIRCVFESPNCGPFEPAIVSEPTEPFQMASFFDPDAPGRPIKIPMPLDISPAGLRKYNKNATFMISDMLCGKLKGIRKTTLGDLVLSVLPWPFHKDLPDPGKTGPCEKGETNFGMFCSLSIPIVTLCAMILLIIMVTLFDIFFRWLPLLFMCFPIPGLKGK